MKQNRVTIVPGLDCSTLSQEQANGRMSVPGTNCQFFSILAKVRANWVSAYDVMFVEITTARSA